MKPATRHARKSALLALAVASVCWPAQNAAADEPKAKRVKGCWERAFGKAPGAGAMKPSLPGPVPGCPDCDKLRVGPKAEGLHPEVLRRLRAMEKSLPAPVVPEPLMWINSGKRKGDRSGSMHSQGLAVDLAICGKKSVGIAKKLRAAGFTCVIEYYDARRRPCNMAHGDLRNTKLARGQYAPGALKADTCPLRAVSKKDDCRNSKKRDWRYEHKKKKGKKKK